MALELDAPDAVVLRRKLPAHPVDRETEVTVKTHVIRELNSHRCRSRMLRPYLYLVRQCHVMCLIAITLPSSASLLSQADPVTPGTQYLSRFSSTLPFSYSFNFTSCYSSSQFQDGHYLDDGEIDRLMSTAYGSTLYKPPYPSLGVTLEVYNPALWQTL